MVEFCVQKDYTDADYCLKRGLQIAGEMEGLGRREDTGTGRGGCQEVRMANCGG